MERENGVIKRTSSRGGVSGSGTISVTTTSTSITAASSNTITTRRHHDERLYEDASHRSSSRTCVLGCQVNKLALCRFPVHDPKRCHNWLKYFNINKDRVEKLGGLNNLRVCLKHFNQKQQMAKTRIKTTPTRLQKDALAQATTTTTAATTTTIILESPKCNNSNSKAHDIKRQAENGLELIRPQNVNNNSNSISNSNGINSTIIVAAPKRTTSVSSATSTLSRTSDTLSDVDGVTITPIPPAPSTPPMPPAAIPPTAMPPLATIQLRPCASSSTSAIANFSNIAVKVPIANNKNGFFNKLSSNGKRKIYLITEKSENNLSSTSSDALSTNLNVPTGISKRKMYLIMEDQNGNSDSGNSNNNNNNTDNSCDKQSNGNELATRVNPSQAQIENKRKKLTLFADSDIELTTHKFEQILPEILNRIKSQQSGVAAQINGNNNNNNNNKDYSSISAHGSGNNIIDIGTEIKLVDQPKPRDEIKAPITLPPKKNRTKISQNIYENEMTTNVPVIVSNARTIVNLTSTEPTPVLSSFHRNSGAADGGAGDGNICNKWEQIYNDKQINLSSDFLFLMKMLPKLESIPEPQKQQVKSCIETFINQSASRCTNQGFY